MRVFIDSNFFIALLNSRDHRHQDALQLLEQLQDPKFGRLLTSDYILDEVITTIWSQTHRKDLVKKAYDLIWNTPDFVQVQIATEDVIELAYQKWEQFATFPKCPLSFTDCTILAIIESLKVSRLLSFDNEFEGLVPRFI